MLSKQQTHQFDTSFFTEYDRRKRLHSKLAFLTLNDLILTDQAPLVGLPSRGGDVTVYVKDINLPSLPTTFYSVLVSIFVFMALSTVFHYIHSPDNSPFTHSVLAVFPLPYWSFQLYISLRKSPSALI